VFAAASLRDALADEFFSAYREWMRVKIAPGFDVASAAYRLFAGVDSGRRARSGALSGLAGEYYCARFSYSAVSWS
jgi:hypothetical protein